MILPYGFRRSSGGLSAVNTSRRTATSLMWSRRSWPLTFWSLRRSVPSFNYLVIVIYIFYLTICGAFVANFLGYCTLSSSYHSMGITSSNQGAWLTATGAEYMKSISAWTANLLRSCMSGFKWKLRASMGSFHGVLILRGHRAATSSHSDSFGHGGKACGKWQCMKPAAYSFLQFHAVCFWQC